MEHPAVYGIIFYQRYLSPHKRFCCAFRYYYGGESCSEAVKHIAIDKGLIAGCGDIKSRFKGCKKAAHLIKNQNGNNEEESDRDKDQNEETEKKSDKKKQFCKYADCVPIDADCCSIGGAASIIPASGGCDACSCTPW